LKLLGTSPRGSKTEFQWNTVILVLLGFVFLLAAFVVLAKLYLSPFFDNTFVPFDGVAFPTGGILGHRYWSSLLSGHYFGLRAASPSSAIVSMMWFRNRLENNDLSIRPWCNEHDRLNQFIWNYNDLEFGDQLMRDQNLLINTSFIKLDQNTIKARIKFQDTAKVDDLLNSVILYSAIESNDDAIEALNVPS